MDFSPINLTIGTLWILSAVIEFADYCSLWQLKEYRRDRFLDFLSTEQGRRYFWRFSYLYRTVALFVALFWPFNDIYHLKILLLIILCLDLVYNIWRIFSSGLRRPKFTAKSGLIILLSISFGIVVLLLTQDWILAFFILLARFFILTFAVALLEIPTRITKKYIISRATKKMSGYPNLTVIGITGSYGKSSVKEFTAHLLSQKYRVIKTPKNINSEIGVAQFILKTDFSAAQFFIVEMGAYKKGEIQLICNIVKPQVGILTAIAEQHLSLFGSIENIQEAKYELLRSIPPNGFVITNSDNFYCAEFLPTLKCQNIETFGVDEENHPTCLITDIKTTYQGTEFAEVYKGNASRIQTPVIGAHHAFNIAPAVIVAFHFGLTGPQIYQGCRTLPTEIHGSLKIYSYGEATIIDDSYNSNPQGFRSALDVLSLYPSDKKRIVITRGMLELGEKSRELHEQLAQEIAFVADELIVITPDFFEPLQSGVGKKYQTSVILQDNPEKLLSSIRRLKQQKCVILLENRMPANIYSEIKEAGR